MTTSAAVKPVNLKLISPEVVVTDHHLGSLLSKLGLGSKLNDCFSDHEGPYLLKMAIFSHKAYPDWKYAICFVFDRQQKGKLIRLDPTILPCIVSDVCEILHLKKSDLIVQVVGRTGSRNACKLTTCFERFQCQKIIVNDFSASSTTIEEFLRISVDDLDRIAMKLEQLSNPTRIEMASLPQSDKRIRLDDATDAESRNRIMFANQMLQIPGITEKAAMTVAKRFSTPKELIAFVDAGGTLLDMEVEQPNGDKKKYVNLFCIWCYPKPLD